MEASEVFFQPHSKGRGRGNPSPMTPTASLSPPVGRLRFFRRDWLPNFFTNGSTIHINQTSQNCDSVTIQGPLRPGQ